MKLSEWREAIKEYLYGRLSVGALQVNQLLHYQRFMLMALIVLIPFFLAHLVGVFSWKADIQQLHQVLKRSTEMQAHVVQTTMQSVAAELAQFQRFVRQGSEPQLDWARLLKPVLRQAEGAELTGMRVLVGEHLSDYLSEEVESLYRDSVLAPQLKLHAIELRFKGSMQQLHAVIQQLKALPQPVLYWSGMVLRAQEEGKNAVLQMQLNLYTLSEALDG